MSEIPEPGAGTIVAWYDEHNVLTSVFCRNDPRLAGSDGAKSWHSGDQGCDDPGEPQTWDDLLALGFAFGHRGPIELVLGDDLFDLADHAEWKAARKS